MKKTRSIILAIISAKNDLANQIVTEYAREQDRTGTRTLGIITKPDTLHAGSDSERVFVKLAENKEIEFRLGWHVLKNRDYDSRGCSMKERDQAEETFFSQGIWASLPPSHLGIRSLKPRLSHVLKEQILSELPGLINDVQMGINDCKSKLQSLGGSRGTIQEQRRHLLRVSQSFSSIIDLAINGIYTHRFFGDSMSDKGYDSRLRAVIQNTLLEFADEIRQKGHRVKIVDVASVDTTLSKDGDDDVPKKQVRSEVIDDVQTLMHRTRGRELPGTFNPQIIGELFHHHSSPWQAIVQQYAEQILEAVRTTLSLVLEYTADPQTSDGILRNSESAPSQSGLDHQRQI